MTEPTAPDPDAPDPDALDSPRDHDHPDRELDPAEVDAAADTAGTDSGEQDDEWRSPARLEDLEGEVDAINTALDGVEALLRRLLRSLPEQPAQPLVPTGSDTGPDLRRDRPGSAPGGDAGGDAGGDDESGDESGEPLNMPVLVAWVRDNVAFLLERRIPQSGGSPYWCPMWWMHAEAIARFWALRLVWLDAVTRPGPDLALYWGHLDAQFAALTAENGPFCGCVDGHNPTSPARRLGHVEPDAEYYREVEALTADPSTDTTPDSSTDGPLDDDPTVPLDLSGTGVPAWAQGPGGAEDPGGGGIGVDVRPASPRPGPASRTGPFAGPPATAARPGPGPRAPRGPMPPPRPSSPNGHRPGRALW